jgi:hypothetical protein
MEKWSDHPFPMQEREEFRCLVGGAALQGDQVDYDWAPASFKEHGDDC